MAPQPYFRSPRRLGKASCEACPISLAASGIGLSGSGKAGLTLKECYYANAPLRTDSESVETTVRRRRILFAGFVARMREERLSRRVMFGEMLGGEGYSGGQAWHWMEDLEEDLKAFGIKFEGWCEAAQKVGRSFRRVEEWAEVFMRYWHKDDNEATTERHRTAATATVTGGASTRCLLYTSPSPRD